MNILQALFKKSEKTNVALRKRQILFLISFISYLVIIIFNRFLYGTWRGEVLFIPILSAGLLFGFRPSLFICPLLMVFNFIFPTFLGIDLRETVLSVGGIIGSGTLVIIGCVFGYVRDLSVNLRRELEWRKEAENELSKYRNELEELVKKKTSELTEHIAQLKERDRELSVANQQLLSSEKKAKEAKDFLENIFQTTADGILVTDSKGFIIRLNSAVENMLGYCEDELIGMQTVEFSPKDEKYIQKMTHMIEQLLDNGTVSNSEVKWVRKDGTVFTSEVNMIRLKDYEGNQVGSVASIRDITERKQAEEKIRQTKRQYETLVKNIPEAIYSSLPDEKGTSVFMSERWGQWTGYNTDDPEIWQKSVHPDDRERTVKAYLEAAKLKKDYIIDYRLVHKDTGEIRWVWDHGMPIIDEKGNVVRFDGIVADITERKQAEKEIHEARDFLESVIEGSKDGILISDEKGHIISLNSALEQMTDLKREELIGQHSSILTPKDEMLRKNILEKTAELFEKGFVTFETIHTLKDGSSINLECTSSLIKNEKGDYTAGISVLRDITDRKKYEKVLKKSEEKYQNLIENANDAILSINKEGIIVTLNKKTEEMYGYTREELLGKSVILLVPPHRRADQKKGLEKLKTITKVVGFRRTMEAIAFGKDGKEFPVETSMFGSAIHGEYILTSFIRDISERKKIEQQLLQSEKLKSLGELAGGVAHDFNNVLAAILGNVQLLKMRLEAPRGAEERRKAMQQLNEGLSVIEKATNDGAETVKRIQEFARTRDEDKYFTAVNINEVIADALNFTKMRWKDDAESKEIKINIHKELSTLPTTAGSGAELREVMVNLINNAIDAMPQGGDIKIKTFSEDGQVCIRVEDTGDGIPRDRKGSIFDPFFTTKGVQSSGLGLSVSYGIINRHRGTIAVDSVEGEGTTFTIKLPISDGVIEEEQGKVVQVEHRKAKILVIEDEEQVREVLSAILIQGGHEVETASSGSQGIEMFEKKEFDLVFTDLGMPVMSGWQVAEKVKSINKKVPVALITGWNIELKESELEKSGVDLIVQKPFKVNQVLRLVQEGMMLRDKFKTDREETEGLP